MRQYEQNRDGKWNVPQVMTNEKKFSRFLLEIKYTASTDHPDFFEYPQKAMWILNIISNHCPTCEHQLEEGDERGTMRMGFKNDEKEYREVMKFLKKYLEGSYDKYDDYPKHLRNFKLGRSEGSDVMSLHIETKHPNLPRATMQFEDEDEIEDFLNFLKSELDEAKSIQKEEYARCKEWHDNIEKRRSQKA